MQKKSAQKGFTLIELMVVIVIIAVLAIIGYTLYSNSIRSARNSRRLSDLQETQKALEQYYLANNNVYPKAQSGNSQQLDGVSALNANFSDGKPPKDPVASNTQYTYYSCGSNEKYIVCAKMESPYNGANRATAPTDGCSGVPTDGGANPTYYCVGSISN